MNSKGEYNEGAYILSLLGGILIAIQSLLWNFGIELLGGGMMGGGMMGPAMGSRWMYDHMVEEMGSEAAQSMWWFGTGGTYSWLFGGLALVTIILGLVVIYSATIIRRGDAKGGGTIALVIGILSILSGAWLGGLLATIAGVLTLAEPTSPDLQK